MQSIHLGNSARQIPPIAAGCWRMHTMDPDSVSALLRFCVDNGVNFFDHADIYGGGTSESKFAAGLHNAGIDREDVFIQSKCGIVPGKMYDFSLKHILEAVNGSLRRLKTDYLDILLLHRPDALVEPEEVAEAFDILQTTGKVRHFGVSNHRPGQIELLKKYVKQPLRVNQMQLSAAFAPMITRGIEANTFNDGAVDRDGGVLDYCRLHDITVQAWSPFQYGAIDGPFVGNYEKFGPLNACLEELAETYSSTPTGIATAWILHHPAKMQVIAGTTKPERMKQIVRGADVRLTREDWYKVYRAAGNPLP